MTTAVKQQGEVRAYLLPLATDGQAENTFLLFTQNQVVEILGRRKMHKVPLASPFLKGIVAYQGGMLPVIDLRALCGDKIGEGTSEYLQLVVVRTGALDPKTGASLKAALVTDKRLQFARFSAQMLATGFTPEAPPPSLQDAGILRGYFHRQNNGIAVIDLNSLVSGTYGPAQGRG